MPLLFSVDRGRQLHAAQIQANALGARTILQRPLEPEAVRRALRELGVAVEPPLPGSDDEPGGASIKAGARLLDGAFKALRAGTPLDVGEALAPAGSCSPGSARRACRAGSKPCAATMTAPSSTACW